MITPLEPWMARQLQKEPNRTNIETAQLKNLQTVISLVRESSPWYHTLFAGLPLPDTLAGIQRYPLTTATDLRRSPLDFLCVSQDHIERVVTLRTSGTSGSPKRIFFTAEDLEHTVDFFAQGMQTLAKPSWPVLILMPGPKPASIGDLLSQGLARFGARPILCPPQSAPTELIKKIQALKIQTIVTPPMVLDRLLNHTDPKQLAGNQVETVLVSSDTLSASLRSRIETRLGCRVFDHWGMTETGYGGGVECTAHQGYHLRELDLLIEIIDPLTTTPLVDGCAGEIVVTTLTRTGMPLVRYRTGDISRIIPGPCPCGSRIRRLDSITGRKDTAPPKALRTE
jgi:phenylacetate-coenzyme A ligase PaaK-like adenylate-forming protein